jgi:hypothetical protein
MSTTKTASPPSSPRRLSPFARAAATPLTSAKGAKRVGFWRIRTLDVAGKIVASIQDYVDGRFASSAVSLGRGDICTAAMRLYSTRKESLPIYTWLILLCTVFEPHRLRFWPAHTVIAGRGGHVMPRICAVYLALCCTFGFRSDAYRTLAVSQKLRPPVSGECSTLAIEQLARGTGSVFGNAGKPSAVSGPNAPCYRLLHGGQPSFMSDARLGTEFTSAYETLSTRVARILNCVLLK